VILGSWVPHQPGCEAFGGGCGRLLAGDAEPSPARSTTLGFRLPGCEFYSVGCLVFDWPVRRN
jgi:hypothetical protein